MPQYLPLPDGSSLLMKEGETPQEAWSRAIDKYPEAFGLSPAETGPKPESGFLPALQAGFKGLKGDVAALAGRSGLMDLAAAEEYKKQQEAEAKKIFQPTQAGWTEAPLTKIAELAGGSLPYMAAPVVAGAVPFVAPIAAPTAALASTALAGLTSAAQFTGSNLSRQMEEGKSLGETDLGAAAAASVPQAALDVIGFKMIPGIRKIFGAAGKELTEEAAKKIADRGLKSTIADYTLATGKTMTAEGLTEAGQQVFERLQAGLSLTDEKARDEYLENFIGGAVLGGILAPAGRFIERGEEQTKAQQFLDKQTQEREEAARSTPEALIKLGTDYQQMRLQLATLNNELKTKPGKKASDEEKARYEALKQQRADLVAEFKPLAQEYAKRKDAVDAAMAQAQSEVETGVEQETRAKALPSDIPGAAPYQLHPITQLMDTHEQLGAQISDVQTQLEGGPDVDTQLGLTEQLAALEARQAEIGKAIESQGGTTLTTEQHAKVMADTEKARLAALQKGDWAEATKQAQKLKALQAQTPYLEELGLHRERKATAEATPQGENIPLFTESTEGEKVRQQPLKFVGAEGKPLTGLQTAKKTAEKAGAPKEPKVAQGLLKEVERTETNLANAVKNAKRNEQGQLNTADIYEAIKQRNEAENAVSRARGAAAQKGLQPAIVDIFDLGNQIRTAINNGDTALIDRIAKTVDKQTLDAILDEKASEREKLARVLDAKLGAPGTKRERANLFEKLYTPKQQTEFKNGTSLEVIERPKLDEDNRPVIGKNGLPETETVKLQDVYDKGGAQAVEYEVVMSQIADVSKKVTTKQGRSKKSLVDQLYDLAAEHAELTKQMESGIAVPTMREKVAGVQAKLGKGEAPAERQMDASERYNLQRRITAIENKYRAVEGQVIPVRDKVLALYSSLYKTTAQAPVEKERAEKRAELSELGQRKAVSRAAQTKARIESGNVRKEAEASREMQELAKQLGMEEEAYDQFGKNLMNRVRALEERYGKNDPAVTSFRIDMNNQLVAKAIELGKQTPEYKATLKEQIDFMKSALESASAAGYKQTLPSKRSTQVTRKASGAPKRIRTSSPESKVATAQEQEAYTKYRGSLQDMQDALRSEREGREEDRFLRGVEVESVELSKDQVGLIEKNKVQSVLLAVSNDQRYDPFTRAVAAALRPFLDKTRIEIKDKLYSPDGEEVLGSAISTEILLSRDGGLSIETLLHEATHAAAERIVKLAETNPSALTKEQRLAINELKAIHAQVKKDSGITSENAKGSLSEFVAEVMSNRNLQKQLSERKWRLSDMWNGIKSVIMRMLGLQNVETMFGASVVAVEQLFVPSSVRGIGGKKTETRVIRSLSAKDIAALHDDSNSMKQFVEQFGPLIKSKDRTTADAERIANEAIDAMVESIRKPQPKKPTMRAIARPVGAAEEDTAEQRQKLEQDYAKRMAEYEAAKKEAGETVIALPTEDTLDYKSATIMSDGTVFDPNNPLHFVEAEPSVFAALEAQESKSLREQEANEIAKQRKEDFRSLVQFFNDNYKNYTAVETALVLKAAAKYSVIADKSGRLKLVEIAKNNRHNVAVVSPEAANAVIEELRAGKGLKDAFITGLQKQANRAAVNNERKNGWQKFEQSDSEEAAIALNNGAANTSWCTGAGLGHARSQIKGGDFYIYYKDGRPEVAVRMDGTDSVDELRGNTPNQALDFEQRKIAQEFLSQKSFANGDEFLSELDRRALLIAVAKGEKTLTAKDVLAFKDIESKSDVRKLLRFDNTDGHSRLRPDPEEKVSKFFNDKFEAAVLDAYEQGYFIYETGVSTIDFTNGGKAKIKYAGKTFEVLPNDIKALRKLSVSNYGKQTELSFPNLVSVKNVNIFGSEHHSALKVELPAVKEINNITVFSNLNEKLNTLVLPPDVRVNEVTPIFDKPTHARIEGVRHINNIVLYRGEGGALHLDLPDTQYFKTTDSREATFVKMSEKAERELLPNVLKLDNVADAYETYEEWPEHLDGEDFEDYNPGVLATVNDYSQKFGKEVDNSLEKFLTREELRAFNESGPVALMDPYTAPSDVLGYTYAGLKEVLPESRFGEVLVDFYNDFFKLTGKDRFEVPADGAVVNAPNFIAPTPPVQTVTEAPEELRFAPKNAGVQEEKPGVFSFKRYRQPSSITSVAREPSFVDQLFGNLFGLAGRVQLVDQYAAIDEVAKQGMSKGQISSAEATNAQYLLRFGQQISQFAGQFMTNGPVVLETTKENDITKSLYRSTKGTSMMDVAQALAAAKIGNDTEQEDMFTMYLAGERVKNLKGDWSKLNFENPAKAKADYDAVMNKLSGNAQAKRAFEVAKNLYQEYNAGLLDFLVQTGALTAKKAAELKAITYVPFYRVAANGEVQLMIDKEHPIRIANIKDQPQLKELVGGNTAILPVFASAAQNTFMITRMGLRNQAVKETAFMLQKLGMTDAIKEGSGPTDVNTVRFYKKGVQHYAIIDKDAFGVPAELVVRGMEGVKTSIPMFVKAMGIPATVLRNFVVRNPAYAVRQVIRDPLTAWFTTGMDGAPVLSSMKELATMVAGRSETERKLMETGAISSNIYTGDERDMAKFLKDVSTGRTGWDKAVARLDAFALQGDAATRAVVYRDSLAKGMSEQEALLRTLESMNFSRRGVSPSIQWLNTLIPFFNAQIQGLDVLYRAFKGDMPFSEQLKIKEKLIRRGVMMGAMTLVYAAMMEDDEAYRRAKPEERYGNWFVYIPGVSEPLRVPIPFELGYLFKALPEAVWNVAAQDEKAGKAVKGIGKLLAQSNPFSLPQAVKPAVEVYLGKSFFGGDIESTREKQMLPTERYRDSTTELSKLLGSVTGKAGLSPIDIDYLIRGYTGGLGVALVQLANPVLAPDTRADIAKPTTKPSKMPFIGGLFQPIEGRGTLDEAYDRMEEIKQVKGTYNRLVEEGRRAEALEFAQNYTNDLAMASMSGRIQQQLGNLAKLERQIKAHPTMSTEEKDRRLEQLDEIKTKIARQFLGVR